MVSYCTCYHRWDDVSKMVSYCTCYHRWDDVRSPRGPSQKAMAWSGRVPECAPSTKGKRPQIIGFASEYDGA
jgi:hypothetical protein